MFQQTTDGARLSTAASFLFPPISISLSEQPKLLDLSLNEASFFFVEFILHLLDD